jgi:two-component system OmpR family sensor kinase
MLSRIEQGLARERRFVARSRTPEELEETIRSAVATTDRQARLADDLLLLARGEQGSVPLRTAPVDVLDTLEDVARGFGARADSEGRAVVVGAAEPLVVTADRLRLEQALGNLVENAFRHGAGEITLDARRRGGWLELHVTDRGPGFPEPFIAHAFERFSRADGGSPDGTGLGLAIVETIARAHGGDVRVSNRAEGGADVAILLPAADRSPVARGTAVVR